MRASFALLALAACSGDSVAPVPLAELSSGLADAVCEWASRCVHVPDDATCRRLIDPKDYDVCRAQDAVLEKLLPTNEFKPITTLKVNFDDQQSVVKAFGVRYQSTLIVFKGGKEVARVTGETNREHIAALLRKAL